MDQASNPSFDGQIARSKPLRSSDLIHFVRSGGVTLLISLVVGLLAVTVFSDVAVERTFPDSMHEAFWLIVVVAPIVETVIFYGVLSFARHILTQGYLIPVAGASVLALLHYGSGWFKILAIFPVFFWWGCCYLQLARQERRIRYKYAFLTGLHALHNGVIVLLYYVALPYFGIE